MWNSENGISQNLEESSKAVQVWNRTVFGNIFYRKKRKLRELEQVQKVLERRYSAKLRIRESEIRLELEHILHQEELFWF